MNLSVSATAPAGRLGTLTYRNEAGAAVDQRPVYAGDIAVNIHTKLEPQEFRGSLRDAIDAAKALSKSTVYPQGIAVIDEGIFTNRYTLAGVWGAPDSGFPLLPVDSYRLDHAIDGHGFATAVELDAKAFSGLKAVVGFERVVRD